MDYIRHAYIATMQFDQAGTLFQPVRWYFAKPGALEFPVSHLFGSSKLRSTPRIIGGVGETVDEETTWDPGVAPDGFAGKGPPCGPLSWFQNGVPSNAPDTLPFGGPRFCCGLCQPWHHANELGTSFTRLLNGHVWTVFQNQSSQFQARDPDNVLNHVQCNLDALLTPCGNDIQTIAALFVNIGVGVQRVPLTLLRWDPLLSIGTWQAPVNIYGYSGEKFEFHRLIT